MSTAHCAGPNMPIERRHFLRCLSSAVCAARATALLAPASRAFGQAAKPSDTASSSPSSSPSTRSPGSPTAAASDVLAPRPAGYTVTAWPAGPTPSLALTDLRGQPWSLSAQRGRVVLLNFWATWCKPCRAEMPALQALAERLGPSRLAVVGVNYQESAARIERFVDAAALTFPVLLDRDGAVTRAWTRRIFPTSVLVGPDGRARQVIVGEFDWNGPQAGGLLAALLPR